MTDLITLEEYREFMGLATTGTEARDDLELQNLITSASKSIADYCNRYFTEYSTTSFIQYDDGARSEIDLQVWPVINVSEVAWSNDRGLTWDVLVENTDYLVLPETDSIMTVSGEVFHTTGRTRAVRITYTGGYTEVPQDLKHACALVVKHYHKHEYIARQEMGSDMVQTGGFTIMDKDWPAQIKRILDLYRDLSVYNL